MNIICMAYVHALMHSTTLADTTFMAVGSIRDLIRLTLWERVITYIKAEGHEIIEDLDYPRLVCPPAESVYWEWAILYVSTYLERQMSVERWVRTNADKLRSK